MPQCNHCPALRRAQGGINLGGRVSLVVMPGCACTGIPQAVEGEDTIIPDQVGTFVSSEFYTYQSALRVCPGPVARTLRPLIVGVEVTNYPPGEVMFEAYVRVYNGLNDGCTYDPFEFPVGKSDNLNGVMSNVTDFLASTVPNSFYYAYLQVNLSNLLGFGDPPEFDLTYNFSPP